MKHVRKIQGISPKTGYTSTEKEQYRYSVWRDLAPFVGSNGYAVIMPAGGCDEIEAAISCGIKIGNIFCFDASPAVIATSKWRKRWPDIKYASCMLSELPKKLAEKGIKVGAINMDLCGNVSGDASDEISAFLSSGCLNCGSSFAINIAKGREGRQLLRLIEEIGKPTWFECDRIAALYTLFAPSIPKNMTIYGMSQGTYRENKTPMTWATFTTSKSYRPYLDETHISMIKNAIMSFDVGAFDTFVNCVYNSQKRHGIGALNYCADDENTIYGRSMAIKANFNSSFGKALEHYKFKIKQPNPETRQAK